MSKLKPYIKFLLASTNAHGVHSPFVFKLITQCFYINQEQELLSRLLLYFNPYTIIVKDDNEVTENTIRKINPQSVINKQENFDFAIINYEQKDKTLHEFEKLLPYIQNDSIIVLNHIYSSQEMSEAWTIIKANPQVRVSIDTFTCGLIFFRKEQPKEHFIIRPQTSLPLDIILGARKLWGLIS